MGNVKESDVRKAFNDRKNAYMNLAKLEDEMTSLKNKMAEFREETPGFKNTQQKLAELQPQINDAVRKYTMFNWEVQKLDMLIRLESSL